MSIKTPTDIKNKSANRELVFSGLSSEKENLYLRIKDETVLGNQKGYYSIPLYTSLTQEADSNESDVELVHIYPYLFDTLAMSDAESSYLPEGYVYIYVDGYLWRELQVITPELPEYSTFRDINLGYQKGYMPWKQRKGKAKPGYSGKREATGELLKTIIVPHKIRGEITHVEIAFSEIQWSWSQILKYGGLAEDDPRLKVSTPLSIKESSCPSKGEACIYREKRMIHLDNLGDYIAGYTSIGKVKVNETLHKKLPLVDAEQIAYVPMLNGLHICRTYIAQIQNKFTDIQQVLNELSGFDNKTGKIDKKKEAEYELATFMLQSFYHQVNSILDKDVELVSSDEKLVETDEKSIDFAKKIKKWREDDGLFKEKKFLDFFQQDKLFFLAYEVSDLRDELIAYLRDEESNYNFSFCVEDYAYHSDHHFVEIYDVYNDIVINLKAHPANQFAFLVTDEEKWADLSEKHQGHDYILECVDQHPQKPANKLSKMLFPESKGDKLTDYNIGEKKPFKSEFYGQKIVKLLEDEGALSSSEVVQLGRRLSQTLLSVATGHYEVPDAAYQLSKYGGGSTESLGTQKKAVEADITSAEQQVKSSQKKAKSAALNLQKAEQSLIIAERKYQKLLSDSSFLSAEDLARTKQQMEVEIATEKKNLAALQKKFAKARTSVLKAQSNVKAYVKVNNRWFKYPHARFIDAKANVLQPLLRLVDIAHPNQIQQIDMLASDYFSGNFPEGFLPLDPQARKSAAKKLLLELNLTIKAHSKRVQNVKFHNGNTAKLALEDVLHLNKRLEHLTSQIDAANNMTELGTLRRINAYLIKIDGSDLKTEASVNSNQGNVKAKLTEVDNVAAELLDDQALLKNLRNKQAQLQKWVDLKIPETITPQGLQKGLGGLLGVIAVFEVMNFAQAANQFKFGMNRSTVDFIGASIDLAAIGLTVFSAMHEMQSGMPSNRQYRLYNRYLFRNNETVALKKYGVKFALKADLIKYTARANMWASVYSAATAGVDSYYAYKRGDAGAAVGLAVATAGFLLTAAETLPTILISIGRGVLLNPLSKLGIAGLLVVFIGYAIYYVFKDEPIEAWLRASPWGEDPYGGGNKDFFGDNPYYCWQENPEYALHALYQLLFGPMVIGKTSKINMYGNYKQGGEGEIEFGHFNVQIPGHISGNGMENIAMEIAIRSSPSKNWEVLNASAKEGDIKTAQDVFWDGVNIVLNQGNTGFRLSFHEECLYPYFNKYGCEVLSVRIRYRSYPKGKGKTITPSSGQELLLPVGQRDEQGEVEQPSLWAEDTIRLHIHDFGRGVAGYLGRHIHTHKKTTD